MTALSLLGLHPNESTLQADRLDFNSNSLLDLDQKTWEQLRGNEIGMVFQEPQSSLNPSMRCGDQVLEVLQQHQKSNPKYYLVFLRVFRQQSLRLQKSFNLKLSEHLKTMDFMG